MSDDCAETRELDAPPPAPCKSAVAPSPTRGEAGEETLAEILARLTRQYAGTARDGQSAPDVARTAARAEAAERVILAAIQRRRRYDGITAHDLAAQAAVNERSARAIVAHLIVEHEAPICGTPAESYYWPARYEDVASTLASLQSRRRELDARIAGLRRGASRLFGTIPMFE